MKCRTLSGAPRHVSLSLSFSLSLVLFSIAVVYFTMDITSPATTMLAVMLRKQAANFSIVTKAVVVETEAKTETAGFETKAKAESVVSETEAEAETVYLETETKALAVGLTLLAVPYNHL